MASQPPGLKNQNTKILIYTISTICSIIKHAFIAFFMNGNHSVIFYFTFGARNGIYSGSYFWKITMFIADAANERASKNAKLCLFMKNIVSEQLKNINIQLKIKLKLNANTSSFL